VDTLEPRRTGIPGGPGSRTTGWGSTSPEIPMPCATVHMAVAGRVLGEWRDTPARAPVSLSRPGVEEAFLHGAMAPDVGFIPGTHRLVSELAHYVRPGDLARALLRTAGSAQEEAFAWGWASHLLADVEIHPVVGRAVGERLHGDRSRRVDAMEDVGTHVSLEVGVDVAILRREPDLPQPPGRPFFPMSGRVRHLIRALAETYDLEWDPSSLTQHHVRATRLTRWWPRTLSLLPLHPSLPPGAPPPHTFLGRVTRTHHRRDALAGFLRPEAPRPWFVEAVRDGIETVAMGFRSAVESGLGCIENPNLETGEESREGIGHPATDLAAERLRAARRRGVAIRG